MYPRFGNSPISYFLTSYLYRLLRCSGDLFQGSVRVFQTMPGSRNGTEASCVRSHVLFVDFKTKVIELYFRKWFVLIT